MATKFDQAVDELRLRLVRFAQTAELAVHTRAENQAETFNQADKLHQKTRADNQSVLADTLHIDSAIEAAVKELAEKLGSAFENAHSLENVDAQRGAWRVWLNHQFQNHTLFFAM